VQSLVVDAVQAPLPLQVQSLRIVCPFGQVTGPQLRPLGWKAQAPSPSQLPVVPQVATAWLAHPGAGIPAGSGAQLPIRPGIAHEAQGPQESTGQQTPSVQWPLMHSLSSAHATLTG
jgi:hypothetical protein